MIMPWTYLVVWKIRVDATDAWCESQRLVESSHHFGHGTQYHNGNKRRRYDTHISIQRSLPGILDVHVLSDYGNQEDELIIAIW